MKLIECDRRVSGPGGASPRAPFHPVSGGAAEVLARRIERRERIFARCCALLDEAPRCAERRAAYNAALRALDRAQVALRGMLYAGALPEGGGM